MQTIRPSLPPDNRGFALLTTLAVSMVCLLLFVSALSWVLSNAQLVQRNNQFNMSQNAAEAAVERVIGQMDRDFIESSISNASAYITLPASLDQTAWPVQYTFSDTNGNAGQVSVVLQTSSSTSLPLNSQYAGLSGLVESNDVYATATPSGQRYNVPATVHEAVEFALIPLFQFAIFYNVNLEIDPGATMNITGPVFSNESIWEGSTLCTFSAAVSAVGTNCQLVADPFALSYNGTGASTFSELGQPVDHANSLVMPIGTNNSPGAVLSLLNLPPSLYAMGTTAAYSSNGMDYPANEADLVISNSVTGTNWGSYTPYGTNLVLYYQDSSLTQVANDFFILTNRALAHSVYTTNSVPSNLLTNIVYAGFSWLTNATFYDWREGWNAGNGPPKQVQAVQIDIAKLNIWLTNSGNSYDQQKLLHTSHHIGGIYVYNSFPLTSSGFPAVRVINGAQLPHPGGSTYGLTVATPFPMYVLGNYNSQNNGLSALGLYGTNGSTANTLPAALMADSVTVLSTNWNDSNSTFTNKAVCTTGGPNPGNTTVNAGMLEGIVASNPAISGNYSGGVENFLRLLENWYNNPAGASTQQTLTYNGSIVVLFYSQYATNSWQLTGKYYNPPHRNWAFDLNFQTASKLPPMTPSSRAIIRGNWYAHQ